MKHIDRIKKYATILNFFISLKTINFYLSFLEKHHIYYEWNGAFKIRYFFIKLFFLSFIYGIYILFWISLPHLIDKIYCYFNSERKEYLKNKKINLKQEKIKQKQKEETRRKIEFEKYMQKRKKEAEKQGLTVEQLNKKEELEQIERKKQEKEQKLIDKEEKRFNKHLKKLHKKGYHTEALLLEQNRELSKIREQLEKNNG